MLDSLAAGLSCVCTPAAAEGPDLPPLLAEHVAATPADLAARIIALHEDEALNARCSAAGLAYIADAPSSTRIDILMRAVVRSMG